MTKSISKVAIAVTVMITSALSLQAGAVSAYYSAPYKDAKAVKSSLGKAGFKVLSTYTPAGKTNMKVISFTNASLKSMASKPKRGFAAVERVLVDAKAKTILVTNPTYWLKAYLQKDYRGGDASIKSALKKALGKLSATADTLSSGELSGYHFMLGMPYYQDMLMLKNGAKSIRHPLFSVKLANGSTLYGVKLGKSAEGFINKIGTDKALVVPYTILIEGGKAYALHAKYYLALSYPKLTMGQFMKISSTPDLIEKKLKKSVN